MTAADIPPTFTSVGYSRFIESATAETLCRRDYKDARTLVALSGASADAHSAAVAALTLAWDQLHESGRDPYQHDNEGFCGCDDCEVRVVLEAAAPHLHAGAQRVTPDDAPEDVRAFRKSARVNADPESLANTLNITHEGHDASEDGTGRGTPVVATAIGCSHTQGLDPQASEERTPTLRSNGGGMAANVGPAVRRLTPLECERLQAWPEVDGRGWTDIPWNGKEHAPDSKRYAAAGNGVTATVAYWIATRLAEVLK